MVGDASRKHQEGIEHLRKAKDYAAWSKQDREAQLPPLTEEQQEQLRNYLQLVEQHGMKRSFQEAMTDKDCAGCPIAQLMTKTESLGAEARNVTQPGPPSR
jgi:uncharacterized protein YfaT (DUF1175 family)